MNRGEHVCHFDRGEHCDCIDSRILFAIRNEVSAVHCIPEAQMFIWGLATALRHPEWAQAVAQQYHAIQELDDEQLEMYDRLVVQTPIAVEGAPVESGA